MFQRPPVVPDEPFRRYEMPEWWGPPDRWMGVTLPLDLILGRSERAAVTIGHVTAYPAGFAFEVSVSTPDGVGTEELGFFHHRRGVPPDDWTAIFRLGLRFADGTTVEDDKAQNRPDQRPTGPVLRQSASGGGSSFRLQYWAWPLPPPGPMWLVCQWPGRGIALAEYPVDGGAVREAASRCVELWPPGEPPPRFDR